MIDRKNMKRTHSPKDVGYALEEEAFQYWWGEVSDQIEPDIWALWAKNDFEVEVTFDGLEFTALPVLE